MKLHTNFSFLLGVLFAWSFTMAQVVEEEEQRKPTALPKAIDFSDIFEQKEMTQEDFELLKSRREAKLRERLSQIDALEAAVDPGVYIVGPGDVFSFNVWGALEMRYPLTVSPEGMLLVPSVGEIEISGKTLAEVQSLVLERAASAYENSEITLTLDALRFFRVHVVGEVLYPGTYIAQAVDRISRLINEAGGVTEWAFKRRIEMRHPDGIVDYFDLDAFEQEGSLEEDLFVNGGDVIYVPPIEDGECLVRVKADLDNSGTYQIFEGEELLNFLQRIRALNRNSDLSKITVIRTEVNASARSNEKQYFFPFQVDETAEYNFILQAGDEVLIPSDYVYVKGAVRSPGAYPYIVNLTAKEYAGMAGGDYRSGTIKSVRVYHAFSGKTERGPDVVVEAGDVVHLNPSWGQRFEPYLRLLPVITSLILSAKAAGFFDN